MSKTPIKFEEGWAEIYLSIQKLLQALDNDIINLGKNIFTNVEYMKVYTLCYNMCVQRDSEFSKKLYEKHSEVIQNYITENVVQKLHALNSKENIENQRFLKEFMNKFEDHLILTKWMSKFFQYLDRYYVKQHNQHSLRVVSLDLFTKYIYIDLREPLLQSYNVLLEKKRKNFLEQLPNGQNNFVPDNSDHYFSKFSDLYIYLSINPDRVATVLKENRLQFRENLEEPVYRKQFENFYRDDFERSYIENTKQYYCGISELYIGDNKDPAADQYIKLCEQIFNWEIKFCNDYLSQASRLVWAEENPMLLLDKDFDDASNGTKPILVNTLNKSLLIDVRDVLIESQNSGLKILLEDHRKEELHLFFTLYNEISSDETNQGSRVNEHLSAIAAVFKEHIVKKGTEMQEVLAKPAAKDKKAKVKNAKLEQTIRLIEAFIDLFSRYNDLAKREFSANSLFARALRDAFEIVLNQAGKNEGADNPALDIAEKLSNYMDYVIKVGSKKQIADSETEKLEDSVVLFGFISEKDKFNEIYRNQLAKRILNNFTSSNTFEISQLEEKVIGMFKDNIGAGYTQKMETMIKDLKSSSSKNIEERMDEDLAKNFGVTLLNSSSWPTYRKIEVNYPPEMSEQLTQFSYWYHEVADKRKISWVPNLGTVVIDSDIVFQAGEDDASTRYLTLEVNSLQAAVLMRFNEYQGSIGFRDLEQMTNLEISVLKKVLHSFLRPGVLKKEGKFESLAKFDLDGDVFSVNYGGKFKRQKLKVPMPSLEESHNPVKIQRDRTFAIEAAIVRIMKSRKVLAHEDLVGQVLNQLKLFTPPTDVIKAKITSLIERDYLEKDPENPRVYKYLA
eukprot:maker-scaffold_3-snap-gene-19.13-mRNA-1 protein AED:0.36 eAED:0.38 QI:0/0/0/0.5/1/1/2/0/844